MEVTTLKAQARTATGKTAMRHLRDDGFVPAVLYGRDKDAVHLSVDLHTLQMELSKRRKVFQLNTGSGTEPVFLQDVHWDPLFDFPLHVDFRRIDMNVPLPLVVELAFIGTPEGVSRGGVFVKDATTLAVRAMPDSVPLNIEVKVGALGVGDAITAGNLELPAGVELAVAPTARICRVTA
jgi:large subunit ribosomal protein L25